MKHQINISEANPGIKYGVDPMGSRHRVNELHPTEEMYDWLTAQGIVGPCWDFTDWLMPYPHTQADQALIQKYGETYIIIGLTFTFDHLEHAVMFKLAWS